MVEQSADGGAPTVSGVNTLEQAMLALLTCLTDPQHASAAFEAIGSWLDENRDPLKLATLETYSDQLLETLFAVHLKMDDAPEPQNDLEGAPPDVETIDLEATAPTGAARTLGDLMDAVDPADRKRLQRFAEDSDDHTEMLLRLSNPDGPTRLCHVRRRHGDGNGRFIELRHERLSLLATTENALRSSFRITEAEMLVIHGLVEGVRPRDIALSHGKSYETVRSQVRSIGAKLGGSTHSEIVSVVRAADDLTNQASARPGLTSQAQKPDSTAADARLGRGRVVKTADGRIIEYDVFGAPDGQTLLYFHDFLGGRHWPEAGEAMAAAHGFRVISPSRAGFARSSPVKRGGPRALDAHVTDYAAVIAAESDGPIAIFAEGSGMSAAYQFALAHPDAISRFVGLNAMPPIEGRWTIPHCAPGVYRNGALAALYAPKTIRLLGKLAMKRIAASNSRAVFCDIMGVNADLVAETEADFAAYMTDNLADSVRAGADGVAVDCTYMAHDWARTDELLNTRPDVRLMINRGFPFIGDAPAERFSAQIGASLEKIETSYARRLFEPTHVLCALKMN